MVCLRAPQTGEALLALGFELFSRFLQQGSVRCCYTGFSISPRFSSRFVCDVLLFAQSQLTAFHSKEYIDFLTDCETKLGAKSRLSSSVEPVAKRHKRNDPDEFDASKPGQGELLDLVPFHQLQGFGLVDDCPYFPGLPEYVQHSPSLFFSVLAS